jgi:ribonuclease J
MTHDDDELIYVPLGGAGEIGMNMYLYGLSGRWLMVDCGVAFADDTTPGIELLVPNAAFIEEWRAELDGIVITHAHEDHLGAIAHLWPKLRCPIYATPFAADLLKAKLREVGLQDKAKITVTPPRSRFSVGPFDLEYVTLTHSIPEPNAIAIHTHFGTVLHTGDWKLDPDPLIGELSDEKRLESLGKKGVLALVGDSTNVFADGHSGSEADVRHALVELFSQYDKRIIATCFASNVARVESIVHAARENGRRVALVGRSLLRISEIARNNGLFQGIPPFISDHDAMDLPRNKVVFISTGCQGEARAALSRIAEENHPHVKLDKGDVVAFSSRVIPGNEKEIARLQNTLIRRGAEIITEREAPIHASGHPARDELKTMYRLVKPHIAIPMHGEMRHLVAHVELAKECGAKHALVVENGAVLKLAPGKPEIVDHVFTGKLAVEGDRLVPLDSVILRDRRRMVHNGAAVVTLVMDRKGKLIGDVQLSAHGLLDDEHEPENHNRVIDAIEATIRKLSERERRSDDAVREEVRIAVRRSMNDLFNKKPLTDVHLVRI